MAEYLPVPTGVAKQIARQFGKAQVVILSVDSVHQLIHTTTYGFTAQDKVDAATLGEICAASAGTDLGERRDYEDFRKDLDAGCLKECLELLVLIDRRKGCTGPQLQQIENILKTRGLALRG
jgi:hypothetical protein